VRECSGRHSERNTLGKMNDGRVSPMPWALAVCLLPTVGVAAGALWLFDSHLPGVLVGVCGFGTSVYASRKVAGWRSALATLAWLTAGLGCLAFLLFASVVAAEGGFS
jgi:hypothetical protein